MSPTTRIRLAFDLDFTHTDGSWLLPGAWAGYGYYPNPAWYEDFARLGQRACVDFIFFGDSTGIPDTWQGSRDGAVRWGIHWPRHDKTPFVPLMAAAAPDIGFGVTFSPTYSHPYHVARLLTSLDHVTNGRMALNLVTSARPADAANFGFDELMPHADRYARFDEFTEVCLALWASVEPDAIVLDRETGQFADPSKVHAIDHHGLHFDVRGPLNCMPSPQQRPVLIQAGQSPRGIESAARHSEVVFAPSGNLDAMQRHRAAIDAALIANGRPPDDIAIMWSAVIFVGETKAEAQARLHALAEHLPLEAGGVYLSHNSGTDLSVLPGSFTLRQAVDVIEAAEGSQSSHVHRLLDRYGPNHRMTLDELLASCRRDLIAGSSPIVGSPAEVADELERLHDATGSNGGFMVSGGYGPQPRGLTDIAHLVVPELQRRGVVQTSYRGANLRERLAN